jgi:hemolysin activation/secretion protein
MRFFHPAAILFITLMLSAPAARAQNVPASAEPSRVQQQIAPMIVPPSQSAGAPVEGARAVVAPEGAEKIKLTLKKVVIEGMTVYKPSDVEALYKSLIGKKITLADVFGIAAALTAKYRNEGYILTQAILPPQTIDGGVVHIRVVEGYVDRVMVEGKTRGRKSYIEGFADKIRAARPLTSAALERYMLLINDLPGISARAVLSPARVPGASDVTIIVEQKPYNLFLETDNRGSRYIGPLQVEAGTQLNNAFGLYEGISFQAVTAPDNWPRRELTYGALSWMQPVGHEGTRLDVSGSISSTHPGFTLTPFDEEGIARTWGLDVQHPFIRSRGLTVTGVAKFDYLDSFRSNNLPIAPTVDRVRALRLGANMQASDRFGALDTLSAEASKGLNVFNASRSGDANMTRAEGNPQFFKVTAQATRLQPVTGPFSLYTAAAGQKSADILLASEEFGVGGPAFGSAYDASEITGDSGIAGRMELRADNAFRTPFSLLELYGFYDIGQVWDPSNSVPQERIRSLASTGAGFRANLNAHFSAAFEAAKPLTRVVATSDDKEMRYFGALIWRY